MNRKLFFENICVTNKQKIDCFFCYALSLSSPGFGYYIRRTISLKKVTVGSLFNIQHFSNQTKLVPCSAAKH